ncbi:MAG: DUF4864 domain-containing protein [Alphaproteobacteria bacterium]|nr:DUF4864 domain-containing protein [Alphaproteobacteria bacterium]
MRTGSRIAVWLIFFWVALAGVLASAPAPWAAEPTAAENQAIRQVIERQLQAFQRDDGEGAFVHAAPSIRAIFGTAERFMAMVRSGYAPVYRPREVEFRRRMEVEGKPAQEVFLVGPDGRPVIALYVMERQADGRWLIAGCYLLPAPDLSA